MPTRIVGISAFYHDAAACLLEDGRIVAAAQEERFTRKKHDDVFPACALAYCLREAGATERDIDVVGFYEKPLVKFERLLQTYVSSAPRGLKSYLAAMPLWLGDKLWMADRIRAQFPGYAGEILFGEHHESHAASAFYPSPFTEAAVLTIDGVGEWATSSVGVGRGHDLEVLYEQRFPHSLGLFYSAFTDFLGFRINSGEYKVMGLAPYGAPAFVRAIKEHLVEIRDDGGVWLNPEYFTFTHSLRMTGRAMERLLNGPARRSEGPLLQRDMDLARSVQDVTEEAMLKMAIFAHRQTGMRDLCLAGGVALNCVGNRRILREGPFDQIWVQPAAGDAGGAIGVAFALWHRYLGRARISPEAAGTWERPSSVPAGRIPRYADGMDAAFLGPRFTEHEIEEVVSRYGFAARRVDRSDLPDAVAALLEGQKVVGLLQGRMEFGPRALGNRSILADPRSPAMQSTINDKVKFRESFRPFAPSVLREHVAEWFDFGGDSPYMLLVADVAEGRRLSVSNDEMLTGLEKLGIERSKVPAVTHVDYSARIQTVRREANALFYDIIAAFHRRTGCPMLVNTSFNVRDEPIVCTPDDAMRCFQCTGLDAVVLEGFIVERSAPPPSTT